MRVRFHRLSRVSRPRGGERGVVLILTLLTLLITVAMVTQLTVGSSVAWSAARYRTDRIRMEHATRSAAADVLQLLIDDVAGDAASGFGEAMGASGFGPPPAAPDPADPATGEGASGEEESPSDSRMDAWAKPMRITIGDIEIQTWVEDENAKYNVHRLLEGDDEQQELERNRMARILDKMRDGFDGDLAEAEAGRIVDELLGLMDRRRRDRDLPMPARQSFGDDDRYLLLDTLEELLLLESVDEGLFYDQVTDDERIAPGLQSVLTCYVSPAFEEPSGGELGDGGAVPGDAGAAAAEAPTSDPLDPTQETSVGEGGLAGVLEGDPPIGNLMNLNTAPRAVLEGMYPGWELPPAKVEALIRWRNEVDEEAKAEREQAETDPQSVELRAALFGEDESDPLQYFQTLEDLAQVEGFGEDEVTPETLAELQAQFGVQSDVFSVYLWARIQRDAEWEPDRYYQDPPGQALRLRAVVWRVSTAEGPKIVFLRPWHEVPYTRWAIPDFQRELPPFRAPRYR